MKRIEIIRTLSLLIILSGVTASSAFADIPVAAGATSQMIDIFVEDSSQTDGRGLTAIAHTGPTCYYHRSNAGSTVAISLSAGTLGSYSSGGWKEVDSTNMPGIYQIGVPNAAFSAGATSTVVRCGGAANMRPVSARFIIDQPVGVAASVSGAVGSVTGTVGSVTGAVGSVTGAVGSVTGNVGGNVTGSVGSLATQAKADVNAQVLDVISTDTNAELSSMPGTSPTILQMLQFIYEYSRNKDATTLILDTLYKNDSTTPLGTAVISTDGVTTTKARMQ